MTHPTNGRVARDPTPRIAGRETGFQVASTRGERQDRQFEYWRALHPHIDIDPAEGDVRKGFRAELLRYAASDGSIFGMATNGDVVARFAKHGSEFVLLSLTLAGRAELADGAGTTRVVAARNGFVALDSTRPLITQSRSHKHVYLAIPRTRVVEALADQRQVVREGILPLPACGITEILKSHLTMIAREAQRLNKTAAEAAVRCGTDLAIAVLEQAHGLYGDHPHDGPCDPLYSAARRYIELHSRDSTLTSAHIARAVGCSRAHVYRAFAFRGERIGEAIRSERIKMARGLLASPTRLSVQQVAHTCGFEDASSFARAFRDSTGTSPTEYRRIHQSSY